MPWLEDLKFPRGYQMGTHKFKNMGNASEDIEVTHVFMIAMSQPHEQADTLAKLMGLFLDEELMQRMYECSSKEEYESILKEKGLI